MSRAFSSSRIAPSLSLFAGTALLLAGCLDHPLKPVEYDKSEEAENTVAIAINKDVDVLFVIDNSGSMAEEQALLSANFESFIRVLEQEEVNANYRIGITTTDAGNPRCPSATFKPEAGKLVLSSCLDRVDAGEFTFNGVDSSFACNDFCTKRDADLTVKGTITAVDATEAPRAWIERIETQSNIEGVADNVEAFQCYGPQGVAGCGFESHLESMYLALAGASSADSKTNYGFLREAAILSIVFITDEADCSYNSAYKEAAEIFKTNKIFWGEAMAEAAPTSSLCWDAGVACTGGPGTYTECHAENYDIMGNPGAADADAVLYPISRYINFVKTIEEQKKDIDENQKILISLIAGVPTGYETFQNEIPYEDSADPMYQKNFGIGPGCVLGDPAMPEATAVPPVREREFAEAFLTDTSSERNLYSICQNDYSAALQAIADKIRDQIKPACMPACVRDKNPETAVVEPNCTLYEENVVDNSSNPIPRCTEVQGAWTAPASETVCFATLIDKDGTQTPSTIDNMSPECVDEGFNLEFILIRSAAAPAGTTISAACELSANKTRDCPLL
jgi:hypothetical protein